MCLFTWPRAVAVVVLRTCVEDEALGGFFLSGCCMAQRRSLSGRSPFCQRKLSDSRKFNGNLFLESSNVNHKQTKTQNTPTTMQSPRECRDGYSRCSLFLGRSDQGLVGNAESTHVNRPKGKAMLVP